MFSKKSLFLVFTVFVYCESGFVDNLGKCKINDGKCEKELFQSVLRDIAKTGVPELGIPPVDPMKVYNISLSILDVLDITFVEGTAKGAKDCIVNKFETNVENEKAFMEMTCDFTIKGHYKVFSSSPLLKSLTGGQAVTGDGNGKVKIDKLHLRFDYDFFVERRNGKLYLKCKNNKLKYSFDIKGKASFYADGLYIGKQESSKLLTGLLNENWRMVMTSFGKPFMDKAMEYVYEMIHSFFDSVSADNYISDDLSKYARDAV